MPMSLTVIDAQSRISSSNENDNRIIQQAISLLEHLPADPARSAALVQRRLKDGGNALQTRIGTAYQGVVDAWSLGIITIPAVVVDQRYVVYGEPDVAKAVALIEAHRRTQP